MGRVGRCWPTSLFLLKWKSCLSPFSYHSEVVHDGHDRMESAGPGGARAHDFRGLDLALGVNGADDDLVGAGLGRGPIVVPDHPGKWGERQLERRVLPRPFAAETDLDLLDGLRPSEGDAFEQVLLPEIGRASCRERVEVWELDR